jgi:hypothetical protein
VFAPLLGTYFNWRFVHLDKYKTKILNKTIYRCIFMVGFFLHVFIIFIQKCQYLELLL